MIINDNHNDIRDWIFLPPLGSSIKVLKKISVKYFSLEKNNIFSQISHLSLCF